MTNTIATTTSPALRTPHASEASPLTRFARASIFRRLRSIASEPFVIEDTVGQETFGRPSAERTSGALPHVRIHDMRFYLRVLRSGSLGVAEAYIDGMWEANDLPALLRIFARRVESTWGMGGAAARIGSLLPRFWHRLRPNTLSGSRRNIHAHYDLGNDFFSLFLDRTMTYSSGVFARSSTTLEEASIEKLDRLCSLAEIAATHHVLEIGTGWGSFALHAAKHYGCRVTTTTISDEQYNFVREHVLQAGLDDRIEVLKLDYRALKGSFDRIVSIEMIEAVGHTYLPTYFRTLERLLCPDGVIALQAITMPEQRYERYLRSTDFIQRYVFPGSCVPSLGAIIEASGRTTQLRVEALTDIGLHYAETLRHWRARFLKATDLVREQGYPSSFLRLWDYYLAYCEAGFAERSISAMQLVLTRSGTRRHASMPGHAPPATSNDVKQ